MNFPSSSVFVSAPPRLPLHPSRSIFVTTFSWCIVGLSALACIVSLAALLMVLAGSHGTSHSSLLGGFVVIGVPPLTLIAGLGLVRRWRWAYGYVLALLGAIVVWNIVPLLQGPKPEYTYVSPGGVPTTVLATTVNYPVHIAMIIASLALLAKLLTKPVRAEFR